MSKDDRQKDDRQKAAEAAVRDLEKRFGKSSIMKLGDGPVEGVKTIPSGSAGIDSAIGAGGLPRGRLIEYFGPEGGGKTTLSLLSIAASQKAGCRCAFIDAEQALDKKWAQSLGVNVGELYISQPSSGEEGLDVVETLSNSCGFDLIVLDSVAALVPKEELEGNIEDGGGRLGSQARMMSKALRRIVLAAAKSETVVVFINQLRAKIGVMWGNPEDTPGGRALKFYASLRIRVKKKSQSDIKDKEDGNRKIGHTICLEVIKNKVAPPYGTSEFNIEFTKGIVEEVKDGEKSKEPKKIELNENDL